MSSTSFGEHLKRERQMRGVSLEEISAATRISTRFLEALENGQWDQLPGGAFNRGFIRSTAHFLGLNEDSMVAEYSLETKERNDSRAAIAASAAMPRDWRPLSIAVVLLLVAILAIAYGYHRYHLLVLRRHAAASAAANASVIRHAEDLPAPSSDALPARVPPPRPAQPLPLAPTDASKPAPTPDDAPALLRLKIEDGKPTRLRILSDGKKVFDGRLRAKTTKSFSARDSFQVTSKDLGTLSLELNGQPVAVPLTGFGQPFTLTRKDLKSASGSGR